MNPKPLSAVTAIVLLALAPGGVAQPEDGCISTARAAVAALEAYGGAVPAAAADEQVRAIAAACAVPSGALASAVAPATGSAVDAEGADAPEADLGDAGLGSETSAAGAGGDLGVTVYAVIGRAVVKPATWVCRGTTATTHWTNDVTILGSTFTVVSEGAFSDYSLKGLTSNTAGKSHIVGGSTHSFLNDIVYDASGTAIEDFRWTFADLPMQFDSKPTIAFECYPPVNGVAQMKSATVRVSGFVVLESLSGMDVLQVVAHGKTCSPIC